MIDPESPLARWSRRKNDTRTGEGDAGSAPHDKDAGAFGSSATFPSAPLPVDLASLPTLESIGAETNLRAFLGQGVPAELTVAALRRGWSADPAIRDFIGLSENSWDFNAADGIPGFGSLSPGDIQRLLAQTLEGAGMTGDAPPMSTAPSPSDESAPQMTEYATTRETSQDVCTDVSSSSDRNVRIHDVDSAQSVSADGLDATGAPTQGQNINRPAGLHRHGGALPYFDVD